MNVSAILVRVEKFFKSFKMIIFLHISKILKTFLESSLQLLSVFFLPTIHYHEILTLMPIFISKEGKTELYSYHQYKDE